MPSLLDQSALSISPTAWSPPPAVPAPTRPTPSPCARSRSRSTCATARWRNRSAPKATISACAFWSATSRRWSRPTISKGDGLDALAERAVAMARAAPGGPVRRARRCGLLARTLSRPRSARSRHAGRSTCWRSARARRRRPALAVKGVTKSGGASASAGVGGMVLVTSHGFHGATLGSRHSHRDVGDRRRRHRHGARLRLHLDAACRRPRRRRRRSAAAPASARSSASIRARSRRAGCRWCSITRVAGSLVGHVASAANGASIARKTSFLREKLGEKIFAAGIDIIDDPLRPRGLRSRPFDAEGVAGKKRKLVEDGVLKTWLLDCATARELELETTGHAQRGVSSTPSPGAEQSASRARQQDARQN